MSFVDFDKIFFPTKEEIMERKKMFNNLLNTLVEDRKHVQLVPTKEPFLYCRKPFNSFLGDCTYCSHYIDGGGMTEGGLCELYKVSCGWGFTCKDNDSEWAIKIKL